MPRSWNEARMGFPGECYAEQFLLFFELFMLF